MSTKTIFLHGFSGDRTSLLEFVDVVGRPDSYTIDLPGFGDNADVAETTWDGYIDATRKIIEHVAGDGPYDIVGHSHGAMVAYGLAVRYPEKIRHVALLCPIASGTLLSRWFVGFTWLMRRSIGDALTLRLHRSHTVVDSITKLGSRPEWPRGAYQRMKASRREESSRYTAHMLDVLELIPKYTAYYDTTKLSVPVQVVYAHGDLLVSAKDREWYLRHTDGSHESWCRGGHVAPVIFPQEVADLLLRGLEN